MDLPDLRRCVKPISVSARCVFGERGRSANDFDATHFVLEPPVEGDVGPQHHQMCLGFADAARAALRSGAPDCRYRYRSPRLDRHHYWSLPEVALAQPSAPWSRGLVLAMLSLPEEEEDDDDDESDDDELNILLGLVSDSLPSTGFNPSPPCTKYVGKRSAERGGARGRGAPPARRRCAARELDTRRVRRARHVRPVCRELSGRHPAAQTRVGASGAPSCDARLSNMTGAQIFLTFQT